MTLSVTPLGAVTGTGTLVSAPAPPFNASGTPGTPLAISGSFATDLSLRLSFTALSGPPMSFTGALGTAGIAGQVTGTVFQDAQHPGAPSRGDLRAPARNLM